MNVRMIDVEIGSLYELEKCNTLDELVAWATAVRDAVPVEYRGDAEVNCYLDCDTGWKMNVSYSRPETDLDRRNDERKRTEQAALNAKHEYDQYQRLKAKFEPQP